MENRDKLLYSKIAFSGLDNFKFEKIIEKAINNNQN
jgi:hypothetical protein